ncbi:hypothetical protein H310_04695 [Aphanomyces invadans]|uniref:Nucleotide-diphospho-sugar transferase domain-containing protein n=1 Tax=Aphanomyces invadans TaxID=157072 RepID=A0A024UDV0_9STRA|nr:hypothetical protein H310_04695 [Aphanomyces invadans]ETW04414.1 hypothetical protein H310_04695 [Aphanomyces invadans]|eukprot:XP_008867370.1 hypothetical protein H310_04695 [Aphanomyces invadans]
MVAPMESPMRCSATSIAALASVLLLSTPTNMKAIVAATATAINNEISYDLQTNVHLVFSTGCDQKRRQFLSASLQLSLVRVHHAGPLTEIISGCSPVAQAEIEAQRKYYPDFRLHFTKNYAKYESPTFTETYNAYNKPFGLRDFLHHSAKKDNLAVAFIDADYMLFKPLVVNTGAKWAKYYQNTTMRRAEDITDTVENGVALAQNMKAFLGGRWYNDFNRTILNLVCGTKPCANVSSADAFEYFEPTGTPYIQTRHDWLHVVEDYCNFTVKGRQVSKDDWMIEMYAYGAAVANNNVRHTLLQHLGPATPEFLNTEYWNFIEEDMPNPCADPFHVVLPADPPVGIHYAMYYGLPDTIDEGYMYYKYRIPSDILDCDSQLFKLPPASEWTQIDVLYKDNPKKRQWKRHTVWLQCTLIKYGNEVLRTMKAHTCPDGFNSHQGVVMHAKDTPRTALPTP